MPAVKLVIVESPKKCDTIGRYLGAPYKVMASKGHIRDLSTRGKGALGIDVDHGFKPDFVISEGKDKTVKALKEAASKADEVLLATDPDREGEAISWHLAEVLGLDESKNIRLRFHEITQPAILEALANPAPIDMNLVNSQETRRMYDRIIGFKLSNLLNRKMGSPSAGRVQSVTLRMIVDNDAEIKAFVPEEYWTISIQIEVDGTVLDLDLEKVDGKSYKIHNKEEADAILARIPEYLPITSLKTAPKSVPSGLPLTTSTLQQEAFAKFRFSTGKTQRLAQSLYEGLEIGNEHVGLISYMRTDSTRISPAWFNKHAKPFILEQFGEEYLGAPKAAKKKANEQDAHEAIRPTGTHRTPEVVARYVSPDEAKIYRLIYERAMASLMAPKKIESTVATFEVNGLTFKAQGSRTLFKGYEAIYSDHESKETQLPPLKEGGEYAVSNKDGEQKFTTPPARYSEAKVVKMMEEKGIGRPSTYASTIDVLKKRGYVESKGGILTPTETGIRTTIVLEKYFPKIVSDKYTADMENTLDEIEEGKVTKQEAMDDFYLPFIEKFNEVAKVMYKDPPVETGETCPKCGSPLIIRKGKYGEFAACSRFPSCRYIKKEEKQKPEETGEMCPECGKPLVVRKDRKGKSFVACSGYPNCNYIKGAENRKKAEKKTYGEGDYVKDCPECKTGHLVIKQGKRVKFLGCTNFPKCRYHEWLPKEKND